MRLYTPTFRNRKGGALKSVNQKIFAAQTPQRKRGFFSTHQTIVGKISKHLRNLPSSLADAPHCSMGLVSMHKLVDIILALIPCHAAVCVNFCLGSKVQFLCVITQSTGLAFLPSLPIGKKLGSNSTFMFSKKLCEKFYTIHRVIFFITLYFLISIACFGTCSDLSQPPAFWWLTVQAGGTEYPVVFF